MNLISKLSTLLYLFKNRKKWRSYSQLGEDVVLMNIISRVSKKHHLSKIYLDIGAYHPINHSNSYGLYRRRWRGVLIEPNPQKVAIIRKYRPDDVVIQAALVPESWSDAEVCMEASDLNDPREAVVRTANPNSHLTEAPRISYRAPAMKISHLAASELWCSNPTLVSVDIEGLEQQILDVPAIRRIGGKIWVVEQLLSDFCQNRLASVQDYDHSPLVKNFQQAGYLLVSVVGVSLVFVSEDIWVPYG